MRVLPFVSKPARVWVCVCECICMCVRVRVGTYGPRVYVTFPGPAEVITLSTDAAPPLYTSIATGLNAPSLKPPKSVTADAV